MLLVFKVLLRVVGIIVGGVGSVSVEVGWVRGLRLKGVRVTRGGGVVRLCMRLLTNVSSSPVSTYFRWDLDNASACCWVCVSVGMHPWYIVARLTRSMCRPHVQPSVCLGILCICVSGVSSRRIRGAISSPVYH